MNLATVRKVGAFEDALTKSSASTSTGNMVTLQQPTPTTPIAQIERGNIVSLNPELLISKAIDANVPIEALERLLTMRAELKREQAREAFSNALAGFQANIPLISKTKTARVTSKTGANYTYNYADIADIQRAIAPTMCQFGLSVTFDSAQSGDTLTVICIVHHVNGHNEQATFPVPIDRAARMNDTQKVGSALTYGRRYALCAALGIVTAEDDDDGQTLSASTPVSVSEKTQAPTPNQSRISDAQKRMLEGIIGKSGLDREWVKGQMLKVLKIEHFQDLTSPQLSQLLDQIEKWKKILEEKMKAADPRNHGPDRDIDDCPF
ncbi:hypothetical protein CCP3SC1_510019 [Gammaproteobacteria bacterium]